MDHNVILCCARRLSRILSARHTTLLLTRRALSCLGVGELSLGLAHLRNGGALWRKIMGLFLRLLPGRQGLLLCRLDGLLLGCRLDGLFLCPLDGLLLCQLEGLLL